MLLGKPDTRIEYDQLAQYIEGWLSYKENKKYERFWFVLRGNVLNRRDLCTAYLFCFKDLNIHVEENVVGSFEIHSYDKVELLKCSGNKPMKCDFTILLNEQKFHFRAEDEISRERWIYALCNLIGKCLPPSELPTVRNQIRACAPSQKKKENDKRGTFIRSHTVELPSSRGPTDRRRSTPLGHSSTLPRLDSTLQRLSESDTNSPPVTPPPRSQCSLPFMLNRNVQLTELKWFYPGMKRDQAQECLLNCPVGYYLLRDSESKAGSYTLTFKDVDRIKNHMITQAPDRLYRFHNSEVDTAFPSPHKAVEFYMIKKHSKTLTPVPYCQKVDSGGEMDYILPEDMGACDSAPSPPPMLPHRDVNTIGYKDRQLPPTPPGNDDYLSVQDGEVVRHPRPATLPTTRKELMCNYNHDSPTEDNGYMQVGRESYDRNDSFDDEGYLLVADSETQRECAEDTDSDNDPEYFEYEKSEACAKDSTYMNSEQFEKAPDLPEKPKIFVKSNIASNHCSDYDSVTLSYENQDSADNAMTDDAPPIPPRNCKPDQPPRRETSLRQ